jgi:hypothetical protein
LIAPQGILAADVIRLAPMDNKNDDDASVGRLQRFAEIYREKMKAHPYMEILARYDSMTEAGLLVRERVKADLYLDTHRMNELLYPTTKIKLVGEN